MCTLTRATRVSLAYICAGLSLCITPFYRRRSRHPLTWNGHGFSSFSVSTGVLVFFSTYLSWFGTIGLQSLPSNNTDSLSFPNNERGKKISQKKNFLPVLFFFFFAFLGSFETPNSHTRWGLWLYRWDYDRSRAVIVICVSISTSDNVAADAQVEEGWAKKNVVRLQKITTTGSRTRVGRYITNGKRPCYRYTTVVRATT